jgi:hypothetical protein
VTASRTGGDALALAACAAASIIARPPPP